MSLKERAAFIATIPNLLGMTHATYRAQRREVESDHGYTTKERERALSEIGRSFDKEVRSKWEEAGRSTGQLEAEIAAVERQYPEPSSEEIDRAWARLRPMLAGGLTLDEVLGFANTRAEAVALRREFPAWAVAQAGRKAFEPDLVEAREQALGMIAMHEEGLLAPDHRDARVATRKLSAAADSINATGSLLLRELAGRPVRPVDLIAAGLEAGVGQSEAERGVPAPAEASPPREGLSPLRQIEAGLAGGSS